jgi:hypothetical protein
VSDTQAHTRRLWKAVVAQSPPDRLLLSAAETAAALPGSEDAAVAWLEANVPPLRRDVAGEAVYRWADVLHVLEGPAPTAPTAAPIASIAQSPVTSWRAVAKVLGVSEDTVARHRREYDDRRAERWFGDADSVRAWWRQLHEPPPLRRRAA